MADSESIKAIINHLAVQAATVVMVAFRDTETGPQLATTRNQQETQRQQNGGLVLEKLRFNWNIPDRYVELLNFQLEVMNLLETRAHKINDGRNNTSHKELARSGGSVGHGNIYTRGKG